MKVLVILSLGLFVTLCTGHKDALQQVRERGRLRVITYNSPTTYYAGPRGPTGLEYDLARAFAKHLGVGLELVLVRQPEVLDALERRRGDLAAAGLTVSRVAMTRVRFGPPFQTVRQQLVYRMGTHRPRTPEDLDGNLLEITSPSTHLGTLLALQREHPGLTWQENADAETAELLELVWEQVVDYTVANSNEVALVRRFFPELQVAFDLGTPRELAWAFPAGADDSLYREALRFFDTLRLSGRLEQLMERHYGHVTRFDYVDTRTFTRHLQSRLPAYRPLFEAQGETLGVDWRLLAAIAYQESHWDPAAVSPTGVRGLMMLTRATAKQMGVADRRDPGQSIHGGARYFLRVKKKIPERIPEPDRTWLALASYNVGFGHMEDARILTQRQGHDPDRWLHVREHLPLLSQEKWHRQTKHGYARGNEPVRYVENVRRYFDLLSWADTRTSEDPEEAPPSLIRALQLPAL